MTESLRIKLLINALTELKEEVNLNDNRIKEAKKLADKLEQILQFINE